MDTLAWSKAIRTLPPWVRLKTIVAVIAVITPTITTTIHNANSNNNSNNTSDRTQNINNKKKDKTNNHVNNIRGSMPKPVLRNHKAQAEFRNTWKNQC